LLRQLVTREKAWSQFPKCNKHTSMDGQCPTQWRCRRWGGSLYTVM